MKVRIAQALVEDMKLSARLAAPEECCGLLVKEAVLIMPPPHLREELLLVESLIPSQNTSQTPRTHFEIDPAALFDAHRTYRNRLIGHYHSHPIGDAMPSVTDMERAYTPDTLWFIIAGKIIRAFVTVKPHHFAECEIIVT